jgi:putative ABC transport system substrate-binding protein
LIDAARREENVTPWRSKLVLIVAVVSVVMAQSAVGQTAGKTYHIGWIGFAPTANSGFRAIDEAFLQVLRENDLTEGRNLTVERRYVLGNQERNAQFAEEFVKMQVDVIVAAGSAAAQAAKNATHTIPIVMWGVANPERTGLVASLAHPGGNLTGVSNVGVDFLRKTFQLVKEALPHVSRIGVVWDPANAGSALAFKEGSALDRSLGWTTISLRVETAADLDPAFDRALREGVEVLVLHGTALIHYGRIAKFAAEHRLPIIGPYGVTQYGALMSIGPNVVDQMRRAGLLVVKILRGANPADLPVEQPSTIYVAINLKTAKALGVTIPQSILLRADHVIE